MNPFRTPVAGGLQSSFFNKWSPFSLLQEPDFDRTSIVVGYWMSFYDDRLRQLDFYNDRSPLMSVEPPQRHPKSITGRPFARSFIKPHFPNGSSSGESPHRANPKWTSPTIEFLPGFANGKFLSELLQQVTPTRSIRDRKSTRLNSSHSGESRMPSSA